MTTEISSKPGVITFSGGSPWVNVSVISVPGVITFSGVATVIEGNFITPCVGTITFSGGSPYVLLDLFKKNFIKWAAISEVDFTLGRDNVAGERPLDWSGWVWNIKKHGDKTIAYGENGVTECPLEGEGTKIFPLHYGMNTIYRVGIKGKHAVCGDDRAHFFIDNKDQLFRYDGTLKLLDYSEYLTDLSSSLVMSYDIENGFVYICDGTYGFIYSSKDDSLGVGPVNITGISSQDGTLYVASDGAITTPALEVWTGVYDLGTRSLKTVRSIEVDVSAVTGTLQAAVDWSMDKGITFTRTGWQTVDKRGTAHISCAGYDLRFGLKLLAYEWIRIGRVRVNGEMGSD